MGRVSAARDRYFPPRSRSPILPRTNDPGAGVDDFLMDGGAFLKDLGTQASGLDGSKDG